MNPEIRRIQDQVHRSFAGDAWHGPSVSEVLSDVDAATAGAKPLATSHSIAELVAHIDFSQRTVFARLEGRGKPTTDEEWWPPVPTPLTNEQWVALRQSLEESSRKLEQSIAKFLPDRLDAILVEGGSSAYNNIIGHAQHNAYHTGQIALLKKLIRGGQS